MSAQEIQFRNHYSARVMEIIFPHGIRFEKVSDVLLFKEEWLDNCRKWTRSFHCLFDWRDVIINEECHKILEDAIFELRSYSMKRIIGYFGKEYPTQKSPPFKSVASYSLARKKIGLEHPSQHLESGLISQRMTVENYFSHGVIEVDFVTGSHIITQDDINIFFDEIEKNILSWHTPFILAIHTRWLYINPDLSEHFNLRKERLIGFCCEDIIFIGQPVLEGNFFESIAKFGKCYPTRRKAQKEVFSLLSSENEEISACSLFKVEPERVHVL